MEELETIEVTFEPSIKVKFVKMLVGATAGFIATALAEKAFDKVMLARAAKQAIEEAN